MHGHAPWQPQGSRRHSGQCYHGGSMGSHRGPEVSKYTQPASHMPSKKPKGTHSYCFKVSEDLLLVEPGRKLAVPGVPNSVSSGSSRLPVEPVAHKHYCHMPLRTPLLGWSSYLSSGKSQSHHFLTSKGINHGTRSC